MKNVACGVLGALGWALAGAQEVQLSGRTMGTTYSIRAYPEPAADFARPDRELRERVEAELLRIDALWSTWREDSEVSRFNRRQSTEPFQVCAETVALVERAREVWRLTGGAFDPTTGRLGELWGFGPRPGRHAPSPEQIHEALAATGIDKLTTEGGLLRKSVSGLALDLSGIVPGYAVDRVFEAVRNSGYRAVLVEMGGEVRVGVPPPGRSGWRIGIEEPRYDGSRSLYATIELANAAVSTSGDYRNWTVDHGEKLSHILNPRSGRPSTSGVVSATVVAPDCTTADALATALFVLGPEKAIPLVESLPGVDCLLLIESKEGLREKRSSGMSRYLKQ